MDLELTDAEAALLIKELAAIIRNDRYFLSPRMQMSEGEPAELAVSLRR